MSSLLMSSNLGSGYNFAAGIGPNPGTGCNYAQLGTYNIGFKGIRPPVPMTSVSGYYVVPQYGGPSYNTLTHGEPGCGCGRTAAPCRSAAPPTSGHPASAK